MYDVINHILKTECLMVEGFKNSLLKFVTYKIHGIQSLHAYAVVSLNENSIRLYNSNGKENICQPPLFWKICHNFIFAILKISFLDKKTSVPELQELFPALNCSIKCRLLSTTWWQTKLNLVGKVYNDFIRNKFFLKGRRTNYFDRIFLSFKN